VPLSMGGAVSIYHNVNWDCTKWHLDLSSHSATTDIGRKLGVLCGVPLLGGAKSPTEYNVAWTEVYPISSGILIHATVWPQYTNVTAREDRQRSHSIGQTVLQTVFQKNQRKLTKHKSAPLSALFIWVRPI